MNQDRTLPWDWYAGRIPENVRFQDSAYIETSYSFRQCLSRLPEAVRIGAGSSVYLGVMFDLGEHARVQIGDYVLMNGARVICDSEISIGDYTLISWNVLLMDSYRVPLDAAGRRTALHQAAQHPERRLASNVPSRPIRIGANVWVGFEVCVLPGVTIGDGSVIGARSVVAEDIPPYTVAAGNPARPIKTLTAETVKTDI